MKDKKIDYCTECDKCIFNEFKYICRIKRDANNKADVSVYDEVPKFCKTHGYFKERAKTTLF